MAERTELFLSSVAEDPDNRASMRYNVRRTEHGLELYAAQCREDGDDVECHGYPTTSIPTRVLRMLRDAGTITDAEYRRLV